MLDKINNKRKLKIIHFVRIMDKGGIETWLMHVLRKLDVEKYQIDFIVHSRSSGEYDSEIFNLGSKIFRCGSHKNIFTYCYNLYCILRKHGPYDIAHSHSHHFSGIILLICMISGIKKRICHSHSDIRLVEKKSSVLRKIYYKVMRNFVKFSSTDKLACSTNAGISLYKELDKTNEWKVLHCGFNLEPFKKYYVHKNIRDILGIPSGSYVIGHVGRFDVPKNHDFIIDIFYTLKKNLDNVFLLLIGEGRLKETIKNKINVLELSNCVKFLGSRSDVPCLMLSAMDLFLFPSIYEGLGLVVVEAQSAGLPCIVSDAIPDEACVIPELVKKLSINDSIDNWINAIIETKEKKLTVTRETCLDIVSSTDFNINTSINSLYEIYCIK